MTAMAVAMEGRLPVRSGAAAPERRPAARPGAASLLTRRGWLAVAVLALGLLALGMGIGTAAAGERLVPTQSVVVNSGDSLWSIAEARLSGGGDVRDLVAEIKELNRLETSRVAPGDVLEVPRR